MYDIRNAINYRIFYKVFSAIGGSVGLLTSFTKEANVNEKQETLISGIIFE